MKKLFSIILLAVCLLVGSQTSDARQLSRQDIPEFVKAFNQQLPQSVGNGMKLQKVELANGGSVFQCVFSLDPSVLGTTSGELISEFSKLSREDRKELFGAEINELRALVPIPVKILISFPDGKSFVVKTDDL
ncbi:MAG: hypothetical protein HDS74_05445 [Bacteroidales bacterium]|nr:hypothetical protein [Bacteroidales bacterium]